ncbi:RNA polymerase sigma-70 factor (ECF subfamily) [Chitinophaga skermanii]|uniref:RNA polymerase sigma factor n=1 Tax=Chitinophaga skermanii TaxID=331697 RepID=A0A327QW78_9BACT|nr:RNA polymerase sigma factor [Chitinophaga skermanii]RAJ08926.1 RNA polymerase sigma-70 factor (ECF subfamily) [Chitinophaga skermanii]
MSIDALVKRLQEGDEEAFRSLVDTWQSLVYNTALSLVQQEEDAEDIAQEVFITAYESIHQFKGDAKISTWLYKIAVTKSLDHIRKKNRKKRWGKLASIFGKQEEEMVSPPDFQHPGVTLENKERAAMLMKAVDTLPSMQKAVFVLHKMEGLSTREIAEILELTVAAVDAHMHRAKKNLQVYLENYYNDK